MTLALVFIVWAGLFGTALLFQTYRPATNKPKPRWLTALELPPDALSGSWQELALISVLGLFLELLMIRWISSEITIFAYFKNFVLIACFLGFGLGAYLCRQPINLLATFGPLVYLAVIVKLPWPELRDFVQKLTFLLGSTTEVDVWGVPALTWSWQTIASLGTMLAVVVPLFALLSLIFVPVGQATARLLETAKDGILGYSVNILGSLAGVLLYTALCWFYQPPPMWFAVAGLLIVLAFPVARIRLAGVLVIGFCVGMTMIPDSNRSIESIMPATPQTVNGETHWSPYQKLHIAATKINGEIVAHQLMTNDNWYQYVSNMSDSFILSHPGLFEGVAPQWNAYNMPYHFYRNPPSVLVLGSGMGNDVAAALRNGAGAVTAVEIDPMILELGRRVHPEHPYSDPRVRIVNDDARAYMQNAKDRFDLITFSLLDSHTTSSHYSNIRIDNYVYTREALTAAKRLLTPDGVMVVKFMVGKPFIAGRLKATLVDVFGQEPVQFEADQSFNPAPGTFFVVGGRERIAAAISEPGLKHHLETHGNVPMEAAPITTDDWPFFYQHAPGLPSSVILISLVLTVVCWQFMKRTAVPIAGIAWPFFFLGAGFMLMESQIVSRMALLFGTTWVVNSITISGLLLLIVGANMLERAGLRIPTNVAFGFLFVTLLVAYFLPVSSLLLESKTLRFLAAVAVLCSPVFFASVIFIRTFAGAKFSGVALGSNLLGALVGGLLETLSMWIGLRSLLLLTFVLYAMACRYIFVQTTAAVEIEAKPVPVS
ncbi:MAG TPA: methyltransferase domain-containing protein [Bryobacteraceae bacterium]|nr:methyltransferase domain-containing protein [Bryobacteraceae bacterium]